MSKSVFEQYSTTLGSLLGIATTCQSLLGNNTPSLLAHFGDLAWAQKAWAWAWDGGEFAWDVPLDVPWDFPVTRPTGIPMGRPRAWAWDGWGIHMGRPIERPMGRPMGIPMKRPMKRPMGRPMGRPVGLPMGRPMRSARGSSKKDVELAILFPFSCSLPRPPTLLPSFGWHYASDSRRGGIPNKW